MKRILIVLPTLTQTNGVATFLINYLENINMDGLKIDVLASNLRPSKEYQKVLKEKNIKIYFLPFIRECGLNKYIKSLKEFFDENHDYDMIYSNVINQSILIFHIAKKYKIKELVLHAHATISSDKKIKRYINNLLINIVSFQATKRIACSKLVGKTMYGNKSFIVVNNAIEYDKYKFSQQNREKIRKKINILDNEVLIGFVGRFAPQKNIYFFIKLAKILNKNYKIVMIGTGEQKNNFIKKIEEYELKNKFIFIDECNNVEEYYSAMDIFMLPSLYEGLPVVSIEAQANGLKCILSDKITRECKILTQTVFLPINEVEKWKNNCNKNIERSDIFLDDKFNIKVQNKIFKKILLNEVTNEENRE